jgi:hypothetical protein
MRLGFYCPVNDLPLSHGEFAMPGWWNADTVSLNLTDLTVVPVQVRLRALVLSWFAGVAGAAGDKTPGFVAPESVRAL